MSGGVTIALQLFYITNHPDVAKIAERCGVNRIWIDLETLGKAKRQAGRDTVISRHCTEDICRIKPLLTSAELMVRVNPLHVDSRREIDEAILSGADRIMLPMWRSAEDVERFLSIVDGRVKTSLLLETAEAVQCLESVLALHPEEIHVGLNDLHLSYGQTFLFEPLADGTVERICRMCREKGVPYGFGGIARIGQGLIPAERILMEQYRLGSTRAILARSFLDQTVYRDVFEMEEEFGTQMRLLRQYEKTCENRTEAEYEANRREIVARVATVTADKKGTLYGTK